ncbi:MAG: hypothetical protein J6X67_05880 [Treponema sp.]|nr:hypothetical protein [Treponema sp.]
MRKGFAVLSVLVLFCARGFAQKDYSQISPRIHRMIVATIKEAQANVYDYNLDGQVNCRDYSCVFKITWDRKFPDEAYRCILVRNTPPNDVGHLFVNILDDNSCYIDVEPQAYSPQHYLMAENWPRGKYSNDAYSYYNETDYWLSEPRGFAVAGHSGSSSSYYNSTSSAGNSGENACGAYFSLGYMGSLASEDSSDSGWLNFQEYGIEFAFETPFYENGFFLIFAADYITDGDKEHQEHVFLTGLDVGYCVNAILQPYVGTFAGIKWTDTFSMENLGFAWKVCAGNRFSFSSFLVRTEVSYCSVLGCSAMVAVGLGL